MVLGSFLSQQLVKRLLTMVHLVLFFIHGVDSSPGPELQQSLQQQSTQVHCKDKYEITASVFHIYFYSI